METTRRFLGRFAESSQKRLSPLVDMSVNTAITSGKESDITRVINTLNWVVHVKGVPPRTVYFYYHELGRLYDAVGKYSEALVNMEQGVLLHPEPDSPREWFSDYVDGYLGATHAILRKEVVPQFIGNPRTVVGRIEQVLESTERVLEQYPRLEPVRREWRVARLFFESATGSRPLPKNLRRFK